MLEVQLAAAFIAYLIVELGIGLAMLGALVWGTNRMSRDMGELFPRAFVLAGGLFGFGVFLLALSMALAQHLGVLAILFFPFFVVLWGWAIPVCALLAGAIAWFFRFVWRMSVPAA